jgi:hypothetical protein
VVQQRIQVLAAAGVVPLGGVQAPMAADVAVDRAVLQQVGTRRKAGLVGPGFEQVAGGQRLVSAAQMRQQAGGGTIQPGGVATFRRGAMSLASTLPSSTPHWSKLLMPQTEPLTNTRCSCSAISAPRLAGVRASSSKKVLGRLPVKWRWPPASALPCISACACASALASSRSWWPASLC